jgi:4-hydroxythreonine-4-phosphate dehydrogenase
MPDRPRLVVTMGDPAGVGPEVAIRALADPRIRRFCDLSLVGDPLAIERWTRLLSVEPPGAVVDCGTAAGEVEPGCPSPQGARAALASIDTAARMCLSGEADAMVTAPVSKAAIASTGVPFPGHTEYLARLTRADDVVMTFVHGERRVALVTTHLPLREVPRVLTVDLVERKLTTLAQGLESMLSVEDPRIAVTALNPHAGEGGRFGDEEERIIAPAIVRARESGVNADGPHPADSIFVGHGERGSDSEPREHGSPDSAGPAPTATRRHGPGADYDAILAMYHDQATIAAKLWGFGAAVNLSLGLPIVRTSVDHGTAFSLAGTGRADPGSMFAAVRLAAEIALMHARRST